MQRGTERPDPRAFCKERSPKKAREYSLTVPQCVPAGQRVLLRSIVRVGGCCRHGKAVFVCGSLQRKVPADQFRRRRVIGDCPCASRREAGTPGTVPDVPSDGQRLPGRDRTHYLACEVRASLVRFRAGPSVLCPKRKRGLSPSVRPPVICGDSPINGQSPICRHIRGSSRSRRRVNQLSLPATPLVFSCISCLL